jgi:selenocysteine lyase/cysteine desulfurase
MTTAPLAEDTTIHDETFFAALRKNEFNRIDQCNQVYLDYTGGNLYTSTQVRQHQELLTQNVLGNPHSINPSSSLATKLVEEVRTMVLKQFNAEDYYCIFTQNASGALHIIGECYPFQHDGVFLLTADNHNSVNGIREYCKNKGGIFQYVPLHADSLAIDEEQLKASLQNFALHTNKLFAFPAQSNVSGVKHNLALVAEAKSKGWDVLLDAAAYVPTNTLNLQAIQADFVSISFYKIFGYPTGLGCLLVHKNKFDTLQKPWFAGGTVQFVAVSEPRHQLISNHERFENGTINYLDIPALKFGFDFINSIGTKRIQQRTKACIQYLFHQLTQLVHSNGQPILKIFGAPSAANAGTSMIMTFLKPNGEAYPYEVIEAKAAEQNISLRAGCFCNPGIDEVTSCVTQQELANFFTQHSLWTYEEMKLHIHKLRGAVRISVGIATVQQDLDAYISFVQSTAD